MAGTSWMVPNVVLILVALALLATAILLFTKGASATPGDSRAEKLSRQYDEVTKAAREHTEAFLAVDYKNMDPLIEKVLAGSTGPFKEQYERARVTLKSSAEEARATSTGEVLHVGIGDIDANDAVVFVAADSKVRNASTRGKSQPRYYRLKLTMVRQGGDWLTSNLQFVG